MKQASAQHARQRGAVLVEGSLVACIITLTIGIACNQLSASVLEILEHSSIALDEASGAPQIFALTIPSGSAQSSPSSFHPEGGGTDEAEECQGRICRENEKFQPDSSNNDYINVDPT